MEEDAGGKEDMSAVVAEIERRRSPFGNGLAQI